MFHCTFKRSGKRAGKPYGNRHEAPRGESGQGLTEYLILLMLVALVSIGATRSLGNLIRDKLQQARAELNREVTQYSTSRAR